MYRWYWGIVYCFRVWRPVLISAKPIWEFRRPQTHLPSLSPSNKGKWGGLGRNGYTLAAENTGMQRREDGHTDQVLGLGASTRRH